MAIKGDKTTVTVHGCELEGPTPSFTFGLVTLSVSGTCVLPVDGHPAVSAEVTGTITIDEGRVSGGVSGGIQTDAVTGSYTIVL